MDGKRTLYKLLHYGPTRRRISGRPTKIWAYSKLTNLKSGHLSRPNSEEENDDSYTSRVVIKELAGMYVAEV
jgi:hypothetical protein